MALTASTVWECRATGSDNNGGGYNPARSGTSTDRSLADAPYWNGTNLAVDATTNTDVLPDGYVPDATADPGNLIQILAGTGFTPGFYEITSVVAGKWRLDRSPAAVGTGGGSWSLGGALGTPAKTIGAAAIGQNTVYIRAGTYTVAAGITVAAGAATASTRIIGYGTNRDPLNRDPPPRINAAAAAIILFTSGGNYTTYHNLYLDGNGLTGCTGISLGNGIYHVIEDCKLANFKTGITGGGTAATARVLSSEFILSSEDASAGIRSLANSCIDGCYIHGGTGTSSVGIEGPGGFVISRSIVAGLAGALSKGINLSANAAAISCSVSNINGDGIVTSHGCAAINSIAASCAGKGIIGGTLSDSARVLNCAGWNNVSNTSNFTTMGLQEFITLSADPFVDAALGNFALNTTAGGGALCRGAGRPLSYPGSATSSALDVGAVQSAAGGPAAGGAGGGHNPIQMLNPAASRWFRHG